MTNQPARAHVVVPPGAIVVALMIRRPRSGVGDLRGSQAVDHLHQSILDRITDRADQGPNLLEREVLGESNAALLRHPPRCGSG
jgi:hypothetical protein